MRPTGEMIKDFVNLADFSGDQLRGMLDQAAADKRLFQSGKLQPALERRVLAMIFEKPSLRTRVSFETAMTQLGGHAIYLTSADISLGQRESVKDAARTLGGMCDAIMARTFSHEFVVELAQYAGVPVINGLTDYSHPCQAMADMMTVEELIGGLKGKKLAFVGDGNNVARSLALACAKLGVKFALACPEGYQLEESFVAELPAGACSVGSDPAAAVADADVIYTDTWVSMGQEDQKAERVKVLSAMQINAELLAAAPKGVKVLHCLPAYRGYEITDEVFELHAESIFQQAQNRLHFQRALLGLLIGQGGIE